MRRMLWFLICVVIAGNGAAVAQESAIEDLESEISYRIIGGTPAAENAWPWQVAYYMRADDGSLTLRCGGSVINQNWILTAAHCIASRNARDYVVVEGTTRIEGSLEKNRTGRRLNVAQVIAHEDYDDKSTKNDIALLRLATPASSRSVTLNLQESNPLEVPGTMAIVTGWGLIKSFNMKWEDFNTHERIKAGDPRYFTNRLMEVTIPLVDCQQMPWKNIIDHRQVCSRSSEGKDSCRGDSGGPLVVRDQDGAYEQVGIVSYGSLKCDGDSVYSKVSAFEGWIRAKTGLDFKKPEKPPAPPPVKPVVPPVTPPVRPSADNKAGLSVGIAQGSTVRIGQVVQFKVATQAPGYLLLVDFTPDGRATQIYPNPRSLAGSKSNRIVPGRPLLVPDPNNPYERFEFKVEPPLGEGSLLAILSSQPFTSVSVSELPKAMEKAEALEYFANVVAELKRDLSVSDGGGSRDWSFVATPYRIER